MTNDSLSNSAVLSPAIIYGTAWKKERTQELVSTAIKAGFRAIDTACQPKHYNEPGVGAGIAECLNDSLKRSDLYIQTKFTQISDHDPNHIPYDVHAPLEEQVQQSFAMSLKNLRTDYLDCVVLHSPLRDSTETLKAWRTLESLVDDGGIRQIGISNCYQFKFFELLYREARIKPAVIQNRFYADTNYDKKIRDFCRREGIVYQSFWALTANPHVLAHETIVKLALQHKRTAAQVLFRYLSQQEITPLTGTRSLQHMREDLAIFEFKLSEDECESITALL